MKEFNLFDRFIVYIDEKHGIIWYKVWDSKLKGFRFFDYDIHDFPYSSQFNNTSNIKKVFDENNQNAIKGILTYLIVWVSVLKKQKINWYVIKCFLEQTETICNYLQSGDKVLTDEISQLVSIIRNGGGNIQI